MPRRLRVFHPVPLAAALACAFAAEAAAPVAPGAHASPRYALRLEARRRPPRAHAPRAATTPRGATLPVTN